ncbi:MAG TPA: APC family permease [Steroidobacteraceae bacterium]|nr:APC family permease [Steroidobacteraceae bacterium]
MPASRITRSLLRLILGRRLANEEQVERKIGAFEAVPAMGLDGLGSSSYGPEAALTVLMPLGAAGLASINWVMLPILVLLVILYASYRQTIRAYPNNGGAYTVSKLNLGTGASLIAASALMMDYVLNVAVGISAGVGALTSAVPSLHAYTLVLCLATLVLVAVMNLRGTIDAGRAWAVPTYLFAASFIVILGIGVYRILASGGHPAPVVSPPRPSHATEAVSMWILFRSFAAGCTAMTGVEAVSNGVSAFREPVVARAHRTLGAICAILGVLLAGITYVVRSYGIAAMDQTKSGYQSVLSQLAGAVIGHGAFYYVALASVLCVLCLSANTSFVDFPRVCRLVAEDDFLPRPIAIVGRRLVFSVGILYLAVTAGILLLIFGGITDRLIPLFAIGAFLTFTMSQLGMVMHWHRELQQASEAGKRHRYRAHLAINGLGAAATSVALLIIIVAKFSEGAWITLLAIPATILVLRMIKRYYLRFDAQLREDKQLSLRDSKPPLVLVATPGWNKLTDRALQFALRLSPEVLAVHFTELEGADEDKDDRALRQCWARDVEEPARKAGLRPPQLVRLKARFRKMTGPLLQLIAELQRQNRNRPIAVLLPDVVKKHWWQYPLHSHRLRRLQATLLRYGGSDIVVTIVPWHLEEPRIQEGLEEEDEEASLPTSAGTANK